MTSLMLYVNQRKTTSFSIINVDLDISAYMIFWGIIKKTVVVMSRSVI